MKNPLTTDTTASAPTMRPGTRLRRRGANRFVRAAAPSSATGHSR